MSNVALLASRRIRAGIVQINLHALRIVKRKRASQVIQDHVQPLVTAATGPIAVTTSIGNTQSKTAPSSRRSRTLGSSRIAKDALMLSLEGLAQSADAFPPLKSLVGGLLFVVSQVDMVSTNQSLVQEMYVQVDDLAASLVRAVPDVTMLSPTAQEAIRVLAKDVLAVRQDIESIARQPPLVRFARAKRHSSQLSSLSKRLDQADASFTVSLGS